MLAPDDLGEQVVAGYLVKVVLLMLFVAFVALLVYANRKKNP